MAIPKRPNDYTLVREAFISRPGKVSFADLAEEFAIPSHAIAQCAADESWALLRTRRTAALIERSGAHEMLLAAAATQKAITDKFSSISLSTVEALESCLQELNTTDAGGNYKLAASTRTSILNTMSFALGNLARALKESGVVGLPRALMDQIEEKIPKGVEGKEQLSRALQQINLTVNLAREGKPVTHVVPEVIQTRAEQLAQPVTVPSKRSQESKEAARLIRQAEKRSKAEFESVL